MKIDGQQVDCYIGSIIEAATSSLRDIVVRVSSSTEQSEKDFGISSASSLNFCGILTSSYNEVTPSESLTAVCEPEGGTPDPAQKYEALDAPSQEVPVQESSDPPIDQPPQFPSSPEPSGKKIKSCWFKWR
ncbi:uncharacterized protein [Pocillopora verrucosa]|uniref:uncharacterized protein isoform X2 n=1 Tax=Pocillopora verrucosa TaxID=203993 RepID=UPI0033407E30